MRPPTAPNRLSRHSLRQVRDGALRGLQGNALPLNKRYGFTSRHTDSTTVAKQGRNFRARRIADRSSGAQYTITKLPSGFANAVARLHVGTPSARPFSAVGFPSLS